MTNFLIQMDDLLIRSGCRNPAHSITITGLLFCLLLIASSVAWAETRSEGPVEKITIDADNMRLNIESGKSVYTGNVKITQGKLVLTGDKVTLEQNKNKVERLTVIGKPARYNHVTEKGEPIQAQSEHMVYISSQNKLIMTTNASLIQRAQKVSSQSITYDTLKGVIIAGDSNSSTPIKTSSDKPGVKNKKHRVNITLTPKKPVQLIKQPLPTKPSGKK